MKERALILLTLTVLLFSQLVYAQLSDLSDDQRVDLAYSCLKDKINSSGCDNLGLDAKVFSSLAIGECTSELYTSAKNSECWPKSNCNVQSTAKAILALKNANRDYSKAKEWLLKRTMSPKNMQWFLEIDSNEATSCQISDSQGTVQVDISSDKLIEQSGPISNCLSVTDSGYWLEISPDCYSEEFKITCDQSFLTTLLFKKEQSSTINVKNEVLTASAGGIVIEKINSLCFKKGIDCDYVSTLWAATVLGSMNEDISPYIPYLITDYENYRQYFPEALLYMITNDNLYRTNILQKQINNQYWEFSNKYYDTALAMFPFQAESDLAEKEFAKQWLFANQGASGCWSNGDIKNNAFLLYSIWPRQIQPTPIETPEEEDNETTTPREPDNDCLNSGYFCTLASKCEGSILEDYNCAGINSCCSEKSAPKSCTDLSGNICGKTQYCAGGDSKKTTDLIYGYEVCCIGGTCEEKENKTPVKEIVYDCETNGGSCEVFCSDGYSETTIYSCEGSSVCCMQDETQSTENSKKINPFLLWGLFFAIILTIVGIIYKDKLRSLLFKEKDDLPPRNPRRSGLPPRPPMRPNMPIQRRIVRKPARPQARPNPQMKPKPKTPAELDSVLKKLKDMSK